VINKTDIILLICRTHLLNVDNLQGQKPKEVSSKHLVAVQNDLDGGEIGVKILRNFSEQHSLEVSILSATAISSDK
jgi:hypothetical protein